MNKQKLNELLSDKAFAKELEKMETPEEVRDALNAKGAEITLEEVKALAKSWQAQAEGELDEDALEDVAGGTSTSLWEFMANAASTTSGGRRW